MATVVGEDKLMRGRQSSVLPTLPEDADMLGRVEAAIPYALEGKVTSAQATIVKVCGMPVPLGATCVVRSTSRGDLKSKVIGFDGHQTLLTCLNGSEGIAPGDRVRFDRVGSTISVGEHLLGQVVDCEAIPYADRQLGNGDEVAAKEGFSGNQSAREYTEAHSRPLDAEAPLPTQRPRIRQAIQTGVRAIDAFTTLGRGQRVGIFAGAGVGKSRLLGMLARGTDADVIVVGLIGERGREVQEFLDAELDLETRKKCILVVETSDRAPLRRIQAASTATSIAEYFRDQGQDVLLVMDSITRCAMAQREVGLASGEVPATRGYPPSVFSMLPRLVERAGTATKHGVPGSITGVYTVLVEGDDPHEPLSDALRSLLDGHIQLSRQIAEQGRYPAIDVLKSLSRLQDHLVEPEHLAKSALVRKWAADYASHEDMITIGAYQEGTSPVIDQAIARRPAIEDFLRQSPDETSTWQATLEALRGLTE